MPLSTTTMFVIYLRDNYGVFKCNICIMPFFGLPPSFSCCKVLLCPLPPPHPTHIAIQLPSTMLPTPSAEIRPLTYPLPRVMILTLSVCLVSSPYSAMEILLDALIGAPQARFCPRGGGTNSKRYLWCMSLNLACCENTFFLTLLERYLVQERPCTLLRFLFLICLLSIDYDLFNGCWLQFVHRNMWIN